MADNSVGIKFEINGGQAVVQGMRDMTNAFKALEERIKSNQNGFNNWNSSTTITQQHADNLRNKIDVLNKIIQTNAEKIKACATSSEELSGTQLKLIQSNEKYNQSLQIAEQELAAIQTGLVSYNQQTAESEARTKTLDATLNLYSTSLQKNKYDIEALNASKQALTTRLHEEEAAVKSTESALKAAEEVYAGNEVEIEKYKTAHINAKTAVEKTKIEIEDLNNKIKNLEFTKASDGLQQIAEFAQAAGRAFQAMSAAAATALKTSVSASIDYESAFAGVKKTTDDLEVALLALSGELQANGDAWDYNAVKAASSTELVKNAINTGYAQIKEDLLALGAVTASTSEEIMNVAEYAGQLGVPAEQISAFTKVAIEMGDATMLSADEAAMAMARLANVLMEDGLKVEEQTHWYEQLGSVIVELGNNAAATEPEITNVMTRIAAVGKQSNFTTAELAAMATAVVSVGVKYESGGTAIMNTMSGIEKAVGKGGDAVKKFADVAGMSAQEFTIAWKTDPMSAMQAFLKGLQNMGSDVIKTSSQIDEAVKSSAGGITAELEEIAKVAGMSAEEFAAAWSEDKVSALEKYQEGLEGVNLEGEAAVTILSDLGINSKRQVQTILSLAASEEDLEKYTKLANDEWERSMALEIEANKRYETLQSVLTQLGNAWRNVASILGDSVAPVIKIVAEVLKDVAVVLVEMPKPIAGLITVFLGLTAAIAPVLNSLGMFAMNFNQLVAIAKDGTSVFSGIASKIVAPFMKIPIEIAEAGTATEAAFKTGFITKLSGAISGGTGTITSALEWLVSPFKSIGTLISTALGSAANVVKTAFTPIISAIKNAASTVLSVFPTLFSTIGSELGSVFGGIASKLTPVISMLGKLAGAFSSTIAPVLAVVAVITLVVGALTQLGGGTEEVKNKIQKFASDITKKFAQFAKDLPDKLESAFKALSDTAPKIFETIINALSDGLPMLMESGAEIINAIGEAIATNLPSLIESAISIIQTLLTALIENLPAIIGAAAQIILALVQGIIQSLPSIIDAGLSIIQNLTRAIIGGVGSLIEAGWELAVALVTSIADTIGSTLQTVIDKAAELAQGVKDKIKELWTDAKSWATEMLEKLISGIAEKISAIVSKANEMSTNVKNKIKEVWNAAKDWAVEMVTKLVSGITSKVTEIVNKAKDMADKVKQAIKKAWDDIKSLGANLVQGIINGIASKAQALIDKAKAIAEKVKSIIAAAFETNSPSKWGKRVGAFVFEGIEIGYEGEAKGSYSSIYNSTRNALRAIDDASARELSKAIDNTRQINATAHNQINTFIDYDRLAEIVGERAIYLNDRLVGRELRNMGVQIV